MTEQLPPYPFAVPARTKSRAGFVAGVLTAALVVGGGAGVGTAAAWSALHEGRPAAPSVTPAATTRAALTPIATGADSVEAVAARVLPSVVKIDVSGDQGSGSGSGIILSADGEILTNNHVVAVGGDRPQITISFSDGSHASATVVGTDPLTDTAVIKAADVSGLAAATIGSSSALRVGQNVVAIGSPFGLDATVTSGIVSALDRPVDVGSDGAGNATVYPAIQTDAAINPGNSGGPLVDLDGNVVGINSSIRSSAGAGEGGSIGLGFAIAMDQVLPVIEQLRAGEPATHARIGVAVQDATLTGGGAEITDGATVSAISAGSAASGAGLQTGDVITEVDGRPVTSSDALVATIRAYRPGDEATLTYLRDGQEHTATLTLDSDATLS